MPSQNPSARIRARDGLVARDNGEWGKDKLQFLEEFGPLALKATMRKRTRVFLDLFAGPGMNVTRDRPADEYLGSPLRAISLVAQGDGTGFTSAYFINLDEDDHAALKTRVQAAMERGESRLSADQVHCIHSDANRMVTQILDAVHPKAYLFVFADPERPSQLPWQTIQALRRHRFHESVDLYMLFPYGMALQRMAGYNPDATEINAGAWTTFFGDESWRDCLEHRRSNSKSQDFARCVQAAYITRLRTLWSYADVVCEVRRREGQGLYKMLFASDEGAGQRLARWTKQRLVDSKDQISLL